MKTLNVLSVTSCVLCVSALKSLQTIKDLVFFSPNLLRIHDNPLLIQSRGQEVIPFFVDDDRVVISNKAVTLNCLKDDIRARGGDLLSVDLKAVQTFFEETKRSETVDLRLIYSNCAIEPYRSLLNVVVSAAKACGIEAVDVTDSFTLFELARDSSITNKFASYKKAYDRLETTPFPVMDPPVVFSKFSAFRSSENMVKSMSSYDSSDGSKEEIMIGGEKLALSIVRDYITMGDEAFSAKYFEAYVDAAARSREHEIAIRRLSKRRSVWSGPQSTSFFQGEVLSGVLAPLLAHGCLSPRVMVHARRVLLSSRERLTLPRPLTCCLRQEAVRRDWHTKLASAAASSSTSPTTTSFAGSSESSSNKDWDIQFSHFRGHIYRQGKMGWSDPSSGLEKAETRKKKPVLVLVHGFGGSLGQFTRLGRELRDKFRIIALDSLGFGYSEKAPVSYNQYLWRDQVLDVIRNNVASDDKIYVAGNSIGGFTAASVAAAMSEDGREGDPECAGLILFNSAGLLLDGGVTSPESMKTDEYLFPPYTGPAPVLLRGFGSAVFSALQPRIKKTCEWLYPTNPAPVGEYLADSILRDSMDPGASDVIASGGKLPKPRPMNDLLAVYRGPVLVAQGALDPLNKAEERADRFAAMRTGVSVQLLSLGHCPMDEGPEMVAQAICNWYDQQQQEQNSVDVGRGQIDMGYQSLSKPETSTNVLVEVGGSA